MKKLLYCVVAIAALMISASCQKENLEAEKTNVVSYTVEIPDVINTKAVGDGTGGVNELVYEVWRTDAADKDAPVSANETRLYQNKKDIDPTGVVLIEFELVNDQNARILFWAQCKDNTVYNTANLNQVTLNCASTDNKLVSNQAEYAAFAGTDFIKDGDPLNGRAITLTRPVAQLNIATSAESLVLGDNTTSTVTNVSVSRSSVKVTGLYTTFNVAKMEAGSDNNTEFVFAESDLDDISSSKVTVNSTDYTYVAMNYLAFAPAAGTNVKVDYTLVTNVGTINNTVNNVPVKPNYRTNIIGNLITSKTDYDITLNTDWSPSETTVESLTEGVVKNTDGSYVISTASGLAYASEMLFKNGGTFYVSSNIDMNGMGITPATVPPGVTLTVVGNLQTKSAETTPITISGLSVNGKYAALIGDVAGTVTIRGIKIADSEFVSDNSNGSAAAAFVANATGSVTIEGCSVSGCEFEDASVAGGLVGNSTGSLSVSASDVNRCEFDESASSVGSLVGSATGDDDDIDIADDNNAYFNSIEGGEEVSNAVGNKDDVNIDTTPDVDTDPTGVYEVSDAYSLAYAIEEAAPAEGHTAVNVKVVDNITMTSSVNVPADRTVVLDLNGKTVTYTTNVYNDNMFTNNGTLTIKNGDVAYNYNGQPDTSFSKGNYAINNNGTLTIEANINAVAGTVGTKFSHAFYAINTSGKTTINSGKILNNTNCAIRQWVSSEVVSSDITVNGGEIEGLRAIWIQLPNNDTSKAPKANLTVNAGKLTGTAIDGTQDNDNVLAIYATSQGNQMKNVVIDIKGGDFYGDLHLTGGRIGAKVDVETVTISGGTFHKHDGDLYSVCSWADDTLAAKSITITGGTFSSIYPLVYLDSENEVIKMADDFNYESESESTSYVTFNGTGTLDLNGKTITGVDNTNKNYSIIDNRGNLTVKNGTMKLSATVESGWSRYSSVISNNPGGNLTVESDAVIEHLGGTSMAYGIDNLTNGKGTSAITTINGATVKSEYIAVRQFLNGIEATNELYVNSGKLDGKYTIYFQDPNTNANTGKLYVAEAAELYSSVYLDVTEGSTEWPVSVTIADAALKNGAEVVSANVPSGYDVIKDNGTWTVVKYSSFSELVTKVIDGNGTYVGNGETYMIIPASGDARNTADAAVPNRLQKYGDPEVYYAQYQRFTDLEDINISNVTITFVPAAITVIDAWNTAGATTTNENINGEIQLMNSGKVTLTNCVFNTVSVSPINARELTVTGCEFNDLKAYALKDINASVVVINNNEFNNCNGGFWFNAAPATITAMENTFSVGRRGAIQFSASGDYTNTSIEISGNNVEGALLWQLNPTLSYDQYKAIIDNNTYTVAYVDGSVIPAEK